MKFERSLGWTVGDWSVFKQGSPFKHLARENTQNTLDAQRILQNLLILNLK